MCCFCTGSQCATPCSATLKARLTHFEWPSTKWGLAEREQISHWKICKNPRVTETFGNLPLTIWSTVVEEERWTVTTAASVVFFILLTTPLWLRLQPLFTFPKRPVKFWGTFTGCLLMPDCKPVNLTTDFVIFSSSCSGSLYAWGPLFCCFETHASIENVNNIARGCNSFTVFLRLVV